MKGRERGGRRRRGQAYVVADICFDGIIPKGYEFALGLGHVQLVEDCHGDERTPPLEDILFQSKLCFLSAHRKRYYPDTILLLLQQQLDFLR